jgi:hypothetical protein
METHAKVYFMRADNARIARHGAMGGWDQLRSRLIGSCERDAETNAVLWDTGRPMLYFFSTCVHTIRTLPALQHDELRPEDVDTDSEDHAPDETRYACMARPWVRPAPATAKPPQFPIQQSINDLIAARTRRRLEAE